VDLGRLLIWVSLIIPSFGGDHNVALESNDILPIVNNKKKRFTRLQNIIWMRRILFIGLLIFLVVLPFHLVLKKLFLDPWGSYWKEILLGVLVAVWVGRKPVRAQIAHTFNRTEQSRAFLSGFSICAGNF
jgi:hypothetical protein